MTGVQTCALPISWLVPQTIGPASSTPTMIVGHRWPGETPEDTIPHPSAHIGGNQVIGFNSSRTTDGAGRLTTTLVIFALPFTHLLGKPKAPELHVQALAAEAEHFRGRCPVIAGQLERGLDR